MSKRKIMLLLVAGLVAIVTVFVARALMGPGETTAVQAPVETTQILAAARDLPTGSIIKDADMKWMAWPADADTSKLYLKGKDDMNALVGAVLREGLRAGDPLTQGRVVQPHEHGFLAAVLLPGKRAVTVTLTPSAEVAGFIYPGDHVDVILTHSFSRKDISDLTERRVSETVVDDVRVLALDQKSDNQTTDPKIAQLATLEVTPRQAEKLALAGDMVGGTNAHGSLSLSLRSLAAEEPEAIPPATLSMPAGSPATPALLSEHGPTWDSDVSSAYPSVNGDDGLMQKVQVMRGKETSESNFLRHR